MVTRVPSGFFTLFSILLAINKTLKYQYLYQLHIENTLQLYNTFPQIIRNYCNIRPQHSLKGNTPFETYNGKTISISHYNSHFQAQKQFRKEQNNKNNCKNVWSNKKENQLQSKVN
ncbi:hypothetical protein JJC04_04250 [Flavobacterium covae]|nr:hypothetical protein [Flavobacterium covae]QYS92589.1 hypothetical protein JJC04_04250 [Flavobacterium covae]